MRRPRKSRDEAAALDQIKATIIDMIGEGVLLTDIAKADGMPKRSTIYGWLEEDEAFAAAFDKARRRAADFLDDLVHVIATTTNQSNAIANRATISALQWRASNLHPERYRNAGHTIDNTVNVALTQADAADAKARLFAKLDRIEERRIAEEEKRVWPKIRNILEPLEELKPFDPIQDRDVILDLVTQALMPRSCRMSCRHCRCRRRLLRNLSSRATGYDVRPHNRR